MHNASYGVTSLFTTPAIQIKSTPNVPSQYADQLDRFTRDFAAVEKARRDQEREKRNQTYEQKRQQRIIENEVRHQREDKLFQLESMKVENKKELGLQRIKMNVHTTSLPMNPITFQYQNSSSGHKLYKQEQERRMKGFLRAQYLEDRNTAGYNLLNGSVVNNTRKLIPVENRQMFEQENSLYRRKIMY